jgi:type IV pilus assembly protein PilB
LTALFDTPENGRNGAARRTLGDCLIEAGVIDQETLDRALLIQSASSKKLGDILVEMGVADDTMIARNLARQLRIPFADLGGFRPDPQILTLVPPSLMRKHLAFPLKLHGKRLAVALDSPGDFAALQDLQFAAGMDILPVAAAKSHILKLVKEHTGAALNTGGSPPENPLVEMIGASAVEDKDEEEMDEKILLSSMSPVVRLTNAIIAEAVNKGASDIHIEPYQAKSLVRFRVDGILTEVSKIDPHVHPSVISRIKVVAGMDVSVRRKPQDGKVRVRYGGKTYDLRVSTIPAAHGEKVVIRILAQDKGSLLLEDMNFSSQVYTGMTAAIEKSAGVILVTGPTGSGKSTTLYACLNRLRSPTVNIITVEDPIEYEMDGVVQVQINPKAGITFAAGLRSILRQDPDIIMVGEIRDQETAHVAVESAQTGHLVLSTLHTNDAPSAVYRLLDLGVEPFMISSSLIAALAQRLVRNVCPKCGAPDPSTRRFLSKFSPYRQEGARENFLSGRGCPHCDQTGYRGRMGIYELLPASPEVREAIARTGSHSELVRAAKKAGYAELAGDGFLKASAGMTTLSEVFRVALVETASPEEASDNLTLKTGEEYRRNTESNVTPLAGKKGKILVADDSSVIVTVIQAVLTKAGYETISARNGVEALQAAFREKPDLVITDYLMPDMDGITLIEKLKAQMLSKSIPVVVLTAKNETAFFNRAKMAGAGECLGKPVNKEDLLAAVSRLLRPEKD